MGSIQADDRAQLELARDGALDGFEFVYRRHSAVVLAFLSRRVPEPELAADLFAETFAALLVLVVQEKERPIPETPIAWLLLTARNLLIDSYRRGQVEAAARVRLAMEPLVLDDTDMQRVEETAAATDLQAELMAALPPDQFAALKERILDERDYPTIACSLRCSEAVVRKRVSRALKTLRIARAGGE